MEGDDRTVTGDLRRGVGKEDPVKNSDRNLVLRSTPGIIEWSSGTPKTEGTGWSEGTDGVRRTGRTVTGLTHGPTARVPEAEGVRPGENEAPVGTRTGVWRRHTDLCGRGAARPSP